MHRRTDSGAVSIGVMRHVLDRRPTYEATPARISAWRGPITPPEDPIRNATPESLRAFLNVEEYFRR